MTRQIEINLDQLRSLRWIPGPYGEPFAVFGEFVLTRPGDKGGGRENKCLSCCSNYAANGEGRIRWQGGCIGNGPSQAALPEEVRCGGLGRLGHKGAVYRVLELSKHPEYLNSFGPKAVELLVPQERPQLSLF